MSISIWYQHGEYHWQFYDGPDGTDYFTGVSSSLGEAFEHILEKRLINSLNYK